MQRQLVEVGPCRRALRGGVCLLALSVASAFAQQANGPNHWNKAAYELYSKGDFAGAVKAIDQDSSGWVDYQLLFNSYTALYLGGTKDIKMAALQAAKKYRTSGKTDDISDPGAMYIVLGEDGLAKQWYQEMFDRENALKNKGEEKDDDQVRTRSARIATASQALKLLAGNDWPSLQIHEKLERLLNIQKQSNGR